MKKSILSLAIVIASSVAFSAVAQNQDQAAPQNKEAKKADKQNHAKAPNIFEGLNLTEKQKAQLKELAPQKPTKEQREQMKAKKMEASKEKKTQKMEAAKKKIAERLQSRREYLAKIKSILTPEQYIQFLENNYVNGSKLQAKKSDRKSGKKFAGKMVKKSKSNKDSARNNFRKGSTRQMKSRA